MKFDSLKERRVVVTGLGVISSLGIGWEEFWKNLLAGKPGISKITAFDTSNYDRHLAGEVRGFDPDKFISKRRASQMGKTSQFAIAATKLALADSGLKLKNLPKSRVGVAFGTTMGEPQVMEKLDEACYKKGKYKIDRVSAQAYPASSIADNVALYFKFANCSKVFATACAAGNYAIGYSYDLIRTGRADFMVAGGADTFSRISYTGFARLYAIAPEKCQPFDKNRKGMIPGEGSGVLILEALDSALKRKARIYAEINGYGMTCDARHMTEPSAKSVEKAIEKSLKNAGVKRTEISYISAHGTGTKENDAAECKAFNNVFKGNLKYIPVSSIKSMLGHTMGAAAALESVTCCLAILYSLIPPTANFETRDPQCDVDCVPNLLEEREVEIAVNNSQAFGGNNACLIFKKVDRPSP